MCAEGSAMIRGKSRMREIRSYGSVRGVPGNRHPYRDPSKRINTSKPLQPALLLEYTAEAGCVERNLGEIHGDEFACPPCPAPLLLLPIREPIDK